jgi:hypothetical protein
MLVLLLTGCSLTITRAPHHDPGVRPVPCTSSAVRPMLDSVVGGLLLGTGVTGLGMVTLTSPGDDAWPDSLPKTFGIIAAAGALLFVPGVFGLASVRRCREYQKPSATTES